MALRNAHQWHCYLRCEDVRGCNANVKRAISRQVKPDLNNEADIMTGVRHDSMGTGCEVMAAGGKFPVNSLLDALLFMRILENLGRK
jgi:hypothetical protein